MAAKILGHFGDVIRFPNTDHFASYRGADFLLAGTALGYLAPAARSTSG